MDVCILLGSKTDLPVANKCTAVLSEFSIPHEVRVASAHRAPKYLENVVSSAIENGCRKQEVTVPVTSRTTTLSKTKVQGPDYLSFRPISVCQKGEEK